MTTDSLRRLRPFAAVIARWGSNLSSRTDDELDALALECERVTPSASWPVNEAARFVGPMVKWEQERRVKIGERAPAEPSGAGDA